MLTLGLTGGIASGKSLVADAFSRLCAHVIDADKIAHELLKPGQPAWYDVVHHFNEIQFPDGTIDRRKLGETVFHDDEQREWLNRCLHPRVFAVYSEKVEQLTLRQPDALVVLDAALLIETGFYKKTDAVIVVYAHEEQQLKRLMERDGFSREHALARIRSQMPLSEKRLYADYIIDNTRDREATIRQAERIFNECKRLATERRR